MSRRTRLAVIGLAVLALLLAVILFAFASVACPGDAPDQPCPAAATNRVVVIGLAASAVGLLVVPFALLAEFVVRGRILYRGAWGRAIRRGLLAGGAVATLAGLRLGGALTVAVAIFVILLAGAIEWLSIRRFDSS
ncbi:MAG TPA: hypothetical protein VFY43_01050 [Candidatus Limnocylindria bacterium]|nr:hypothetical protein [Candidatus Limnocylindria bacterium]